MKRRQRQARRKQILTRRREDGQFFAHGTIPASASRAAMCPCGARTFSRGDDPLDDFDDAHWSCDAADWT
jgi:hypothetical protein